MNVLSVKSVDTFVSAASQPLAIATSAAKSVVDFGSRTKAVLTSDRARQVYKVLWKITSLILLLITFALLSIVDAVDGLVSGLKDESNGETVSDRMGKLISTWFQGVHMALVNRVGVLSDRHASKLVSALNRKAIA